MTTRWDQPPNEPSIPDPWIEQTDDQALDRSRVIYTGNKWAQWLGFSDFYPAFCSLFWPYPTTRLRGEIDLPTNLWFPTPELNYRWSSSRKIQGYIYREELSSKARVFCLFTWASAAFWPCYHRRDYATQPIPNKPSIPDPRIEQTDDQALGRPRSLYNRPHPNKPSIPDPRIDQTDDQALGRPRSLYIRLHPNKSLIPDPWIIHTDDQASCRYMSGSYFSLCS